LRSVLNSIFVYISYTYIAFAQVVVDSTAEDVFADTSSNDYTFLKILLAGALLMFSGVSFYIFWRSRKDSKVSSFENSEPTILNETVINSQEQIGEKEAKIISDVDVHDLDDEKDGVYQNSASGESDPFGNDSEYKKPKLKISIKGNEAKLVFE